MEDFQFSTTILDLPIDCLNVICSFWTYFQINLFKSSCRYLLNCRLYICDNVSNIIASGTTDINASSIPVELLSPIFEDIYAEAIEHGSIVILSKLGATQPISRKSNGARQIMDIIGREKDLAMLKYLDDTGIIKYEEIFDYIILHRPVHIIMEILQIIGVRLVRISILNLFSILDRFHDDEGQCINLIHLFLGRKLERIDETEICDLLLDTPEFFIQWICRHGYIPNTIATNCMLDLLRGSRDSYTNNFVIRPQILNFIDLKYGLADFDQAVRINNYAHAVYLSKKTLILENFGRPFTWNHISLQPKYQRLFEFAYRMIKVPYDYSEIILDGQITLGEEQGKILLDVLRKGAHMDDLNSIRSILKISGDAMRDILNMCMKSWNMTNLLIIDDDRTDILQGIVKYCDRSIIINLLVRQFYQIRKTQLKNSKIITGLNKSLSLVSHIQELKGRFQDRVLRDQECIAIIKKNGLWEYNRGYRNSPSKR